MTTEVLQEETRSSETAFDRGHLAAIFQTINKSLRHEQEKRHERSPHL